MKTVFECANRQEAAVVAARLEGEGITAFIRSDDCGGGSPDLAFVGGVEVRVRDEDEPAARSVLSTVSATPVPPDVGAPLPAQVVTNWNLGRSMRTRPLGKRMHGWPRQ
jgi:hypothetical protein